MGRREEAILEPKWVRTILLLSEGRSEHDGLCSAQSDLLLRFGILVALSVWQFAWRKRFYAVTDTPKGHAIEFEGLYILLFGSLYINAKLNSFRDKPITTS